MNAIHNLTGGHKMTQDQITMRKIFLKLQVAILTSETYDGLKSRIEKILEEFPDEVTFRKSVAQSIAA